MDIPNLEHRGSKLGSVHSREVLNNFMWNILFMGFLMVAEYYRQLSNFDEWLLNELRPDWMNDSVNYVLISRLLFSLFLLVVSVLRATRLAGSSIKGARFMVILAFDVNPLPRAVVQWTTGVKCQAVVLCTTSIACWRCWACWRGANVLKVPSSYPVYN